MTEEQPAYVAALKYICCPSCGAGRGRPCTRGMTTDAPEVPMHAERISKAEEWLRTRPPVDERLFYALREAGFDEGDAATATRVAPDVTSV